MADADSHDEAAARVDADDTALDEGVSGAQGAPPPVWLETPALKGLWATLNAPASRLPLFEERDGKLYLADGGSLPHTYRGFFDVIADDSSLALLVKCRVGGCDSKAIPVTHNGKVNFSNAATHVKSHFRGIMTHEAMQTMLAKQAAAAGKGAGASASASESGDVGEGAAKRPRMSSTSVANDTMDGSVVVNGFTFTKEQLKKMWAELVVMGMLPFNIVRNPGVVGFMSALGVPVSPYTTVHREVARNFELRKNEVTAAIKKAMEPNVLKFDVGTGGDVKVEINTMMHLAHDNWTSTAGQNFMGIGLTLPLLSREMGGSGGSVVTSRPHTVVLGFRHFLPPPGSDADHSARLYRSHYYDCLLEYDLGSSNLLTVSADTTNVNYASVMDEHIHNGVVVSFKSCMFVPCGEHEAHLAGKHVGREPYMSAATSAANSLSVFLMASDKRRNPLLEVQVARGVARPKLPVSKCPTRFFYVVYQLKRLLELDTALVDLRQRWSDAKVAWLTEFTTLHDAWNGQVTAANFITALFEPLVAQFTRLGSESEFTLSIRPWIFYSWNNHALSFLTKPDLPVGMLPVVHAFQHQLWLRFAPSAIITKNNALPEIKRQGPVLALSPHDSEERIQLDDITNVAAWLDPATHAFWRKRGGNRNDALARLQVTLVRAAAKSLEKLDSDEDVAMQGAGGVDAPAVAGNPAPAAAGGTAAAAGAGTAAAAGAAAGGALGTAGVGVPLWYGAANIKAALKMIKERPRDLFEDDNEFEKQTERLSGNERARRKAKGEKEQIANDVAGASAREKVTAFMFEQLDVELAAFEEEMADTQDKGRTVTLFGLPDQANGARARYAYWPSKQKVWPLLATLAPMVLCTRWTAMALERLNSKAGIIISRLRARLTPEMAGRLIVGVDWARKAAGPDNIFASHAEAVDFAAQLDDASFDE